MASESLPLIFAYFCFLKPIKLGIHMFLIFQLLDVFRFSFFFKLCFIFIILFNKIIIFSFQKSTARLTNDMSYFMLCVYLKIEILKLKVSSLHYPLLLLLHHNIHLHLLHPKPTSLANNNNNQIS